jgi:hypothetical protein
MSSKLIYTTGLSLFKRNLNLFAVRLPLYSLQFSTQIANFVAHFVCPQIPTKSPISHWSPEPAWRDWVLSEFNICGISKNFEYRGIPFPAICGEKFGGFSNGL